MKKVLHTAATTGQTYAEAVKTIKAADKTAININHQTKARETQQSTGTDESIKNEVIKEVTDIIAKEIKQLRETLERNITETFDKMKSCMIELKKAVESDMDRRDEAIHLNYVTEDTFWYKLHNQAKTFYDAIQHLIGLHEAMLGKKQPSDTYIKHWDNLVGKNEYTAILVNHLSKNAQQAETSTNRAGFNPDAQTAPDPIINSNN